MAWMFPGEDEQPATRRDLAREREIIEASTRAGQAEMGTDMVEGFRQAEQSVAKLRTDMAERFRLAKQHTAERFSKVDVRLTNQTRFLAGLMIVILAAVLSGR